MAAEDDANAVDDERREENVKRRRKCEGEENVKVGVKVRKVKQTKQSYREREECVKRWSRGEES